MRSHSIGSRFDIAQMNCAQLNFSVYAARMTQKDSPPESFPVRLDSMLCFAVYATAHAFTRFYKPRLEALDLTYPQYLVFVALWEKDDVTVGALGSRLFLDSGTITPLVKRLEARDLVRRVRDSADERQVRILLTPAGRALQAKAAAIPLKVAEGVELDAAGAERLRRDLLDLRERLDAGGGMAERGDGDSLPFAEGRHSRFNVRASGKK